MQFVRAGGCKWAIGYCYGKTMDVPDGRFITFFLYNKQ